MNKQITRIILGLVIIAIGVSTLLDALNITFFNSFFENWWPLIVIIVGILMLINHSRQFVWPLIVIATARARYCHI
jgi:cell wall-active antibiotic response 4TMS protein YvqF